MTVERADTPTGPRRAALIFIFLTVVLDMLALGVIIPVLAPLVVGFVHGDVPNAAGYVGAMGTLWAVMQFLGSPIQGALSDRFGRRPIVLLSNFGLGLDYVVMAVAPTLGWLFVGRAISGLTSASVTIAGAYIADVTPPEKRAAGFGMIGVAFGIGFILGPALGGLLGHYGARLPFWVSAGLSLTNACYGLLILPESLPKDRRSAFTWRRANPIGALDLLFREPILIGLGGVFFLYYLAHQSLPAVFVLYAGYRYGWDDRMVGLTLAAVGGLSMIVQGLLVRRAVARFGERACLIFGLLAGAVGFSIYGWAPTGPLFWLGLPIMALWGLASPAAQGLMTRHVAPTEQGRLQGAIGSITGITGIIGPALFTQIFAYSIGPLHDLDIPGAAYSLAALFLFLGAVVAAVATRAPAVAPTPSS